MHSNSDIIKLWYKMSRKIRYILIALTLISVVLVSGCSLLLPKSPTLPPTPNSTENINPNWVFPSGNSHATIPLPSIVDAVAQTMPSVVSVITEMLGSGFLGQYTQSAAGSGVIVDSKGYIVTNNHVVENAKSVQVELIDGKTFPAKIVGTDRISDLAVLKIDATNLPYASLGDSSQLRLGVWVVAIGNALGEGISAAEGIISRLNVSVNVEGNTLYGLIQTTAAINPGNSGGPLVDMAAEVIGITSVKMAAVGVESMGYAISINSAKPIIEELIHKGYVTRPWLGVTLSSVNPFVAALNGLSVDKGALIEELIAGSPADAAGLKKGDVVVMFGGKEITNVDDLVQAIRACQVGQRVKIDFVRGKDRRTTEAQVSERR